MTALSNPKFTKTQLTSVSHFIKQNGGDAERSPCFISMTPDAFSAASTRVSYMTVPMFNCKIGN
jgi:hypothetical protein